MTYLETRRHELRTRRLLMVDGNLMANSQAAEGATSARVNAGGYWGFASSSDGGGETLARVTDQAQRNAAAMARFGARDTTPLPGGAYTGRHEVTGRPGISQAEAIERLEAVTAWCRQRYPQLKSVRIMAHEEHHSKQVANSLGADALNTIGRAVWLVDMVATGKDGAPVEVREILSTRGTFADLDVTPEALAPRLDELHGHLRAKCEAVPARGGVHTVVIGPNIAGVLAHEAMGHPCEADIVRGGAVTRELVGQRVASELVTMVDAAHTFQGRQCLVPVYCDDEGTPARDAVIIKDGVLMEFMSNREAAAQMGIPATGNARAYAPSDEPLIRMRNTFFVPGTSKLEDMIAGVDDGYLMLHRGNGQADTTTEFMFGITLGYEIKNGKVGRAIRDTTVSGSAIKVLQSTDAVSDDMYWATAGYCGKKQPMVVSMGGPAMRVKMHVGGQA
ncbi:TldD/PmbA family protein [Ramlibacter albus]|uniref:TldD/PmbA family protein n=1 Tax=Ramlibacter albus TaxID=2079448 RepID=A0A923M792_9BURK|nr:TldD/PmbA family protein [Ramlibacter albus]MBC5765046.1 TldD/PmbA family protein [Ramlibacter albus]